MSSVGSAGIDPTLLRNYRILRRPVAPGDQLPSSVLARQQQLAAIARGAHGPQSLAARSQASLGLSPSLARRAVIPGTKLEAWLEPGRHGFCVLLAEVTVGGPPNDGGFGDGCGPVAISLSAGTGGGAFLAAGPPLAPGASGSPALASGIVPDRVSSVELVTATGATSGLRLAEGFFATRFAAGDRLYAVIGRTRRLIDTPLPGGGVPVGTPG